METLNRSNNTLYYIKVVGLSDSNAFNDQKRMGVDICVVKLILNSEEIHNNSMVARHWYWIGKSSAQSIYIYL